MQLVDIIARHIDWSFHTFGPSARTAGLIAHLRKELAEVEVNPDDLFEWIDIIILAIDGAWRRGNTPDRIVQALLDKQALNEARQWPDWRTFAEGEPIEHKREE